MSIKERISRYVIALAAALGIGAAPLMSGCENLPGSRTEQATVIGGASGAVLGAVIAKENRLIGALIGGLLGAGGGYLIGAKTDWFGKDNDEVRQEASESVANAQANPATPEQARRAKTADVNSDGFVTLDEIVAMERAGLTDRQMIDRLEAANQIYDLNTEQRQYLLDEGVSPTVVNRMLAINRAERDRLLAGTTISDDVISRPRGFDRD